MCARTHKHTGFPVEGSCRSGRAKADRQVQMEEGPSRQGTVPARHAGGTTLARWGRGARTSGGWVVGVKLAWSV